MDTKVEPIVSNLTLHISRQRWDSILAQGYSLGYYAKLNTALSEGDTAFHVLDGEHGHCADCGNDFDSIGAETPIDIENIKAGSRQRTGAAQGDGV